MIKLNRRTTCGIACIALALMVGGCGGGGGSPDSAPAALGDTGSGNNASGGGAIVATPLAITNTTPTTYQWSTLSEGVAVYVDRAYTFNSIPATAQGIQYLQTANDDKAISDPAAIQFDVNQPVTVFVAYDNRVSSLPSWLQSWTDSGTTWGTTDVGHDVFQKDFPAGTVTLGGNEFGRSMYSVGVALPGGGQGGPLTLSGTPTTSIAAGVSYIFVPTVSGGAGVRALSITNKPAWASFNTTTGALTGAPATGDVGMVSSGIVISASSGQESVSLGAFTVTVLGSANGAATLAWSAPTQNSDNTPLTDLAGFTVHYGTSVGNYPNSKRINNPGITTAMIENLAPGNWVFVVTAFDQSGNESGYSNVAAKTITMP